MVWPWGVPKLAGSAALQLCALAQEGQVSFVYVQEGTGERVFAPNSRFIEGPPHADEIDKDYLTSAELLHMDALYLEPSIAAARMMKDNGVMANTVGWGSAGFPSWTYPRPVTSR